MPLFLTFLVMAALSPVPESPPFPDLPSFEPPPVPPPAPDLPPPAVGPFDLPEPPAPPAALAEEVIQDAVDAIAAVLPPGWEIARIQRNVVPTGWQGEPRSVLVRLEDGTIRFPHDEGFLYRPFWKIWLLPRDWEGRMEIMPLGGEAPAALLLGDGDRFRALARTLGRNDWPEGSRVIARALGLDARPLPSRPTHTVDASAMQRLYQRLDSATGGHADRWVRQIYGIAESRDLVYVELLTWDKRSPDAADPTSLGEPAETETQFLARETLAAFPEKQALYLRRVTERSFGDVLRVGGTAARRPADWSEAIRTGASPGGSGASCSGS